MTATFCLRVEAFLSDFRASNALLGPRHVERHHRQSNFTVRITWLSEDIAEHGFARLVHFALKMGVLRRRRRDLSEHRAEIRVSAEHHDGRLRIPLAQI